MPDYLLRGLEEIHKALFTGVDGEPVIAFNTFRQKKVIYNGRSITIIEDLRRLGLIFWLRIGRPDKHTRCLCGWKNKIKNYFILKGQEEYKKNEII